MPTLMGRKAVLLDGYVDEPAMLGVPPYLSPLARYSFGALKSAGWDVSYVTVDQWRQGARIPDADLIAVVHGAIVPGKYLRGMPMSQREAATMARSFRGTKAIGGAAVRFSQDSAAFEGYDFTAKMDLDAMLWGLASDGDARDRWRTPAEWAKWSMKGAELARLHPDFPQPLVAEIDTSRGCVRYFCGGCSFCSEPSYGKPYFRPPDEIIAEVGALAKVGVENFRIGGQACIYSYMAEGVGKTETPTPNVKALRELFEGIRKAAPNLKVLHLDNANPAVIAEHPREARAATEIFVEHCTPGNVLALGMESADPAVRVANNLNATDEQVAFAVRLLNDVGGRRGKNGLPELLPGINILSGLDGETKKTFEFNLRFLQETLDEGLMLRRINIRQVAPRVKDFNTRKHYGDFRKFKERVRREIDEPMMARVAPLGAVLCGVYLEVNIGGSTFGRQPGSYPILCEFPYKSELDRFVDALVVGQGPKSLHCVETPLAVNSAAMSALEALPGVGRKRARRIMAGRPYRSFEQFAKALDDAAVAESLGRHVLFK
jgi:radical SAM superfamily enzyme with C-terminal helix-hairpin-helix motif